MFPLKQNKMRLSSKSPQDPSWTQCKDPQVTEAGPLVLIYHWLLWKETVAEKLTFAEARPRAKFRPERSVILSQKGSVECLPLPAEMHGSPGRGGRCCQPEKLTYALASGALTRQQSYTGTWIFFSFKTALIYFISRISSLQLNFYKKLSISMWLHFYA